MRETRFKDTEIGRIPEDWEVVSLLDRGTLQKNSVNPQLNKEKLFVEYSMPSFDEGKQPVVKEGREMQSNRTCISSPVLLFNKLNVRQHRIWYINLCPSNAVCSTEFLPYSSKDISLELLQYIVGTKKVTEDFIGMSRGTSNSQKRIAPSDFLEYKIALPSSATEQSHIASALTSIDNLISSLDKLIGKKKNIKQGTMQQLLTGKKRIKGYKGEWRSFQLGKCASIKARIGWQGLTTNEYLDSGDYYLITGSDFNDGTIAWNNCHFVSEERYIQDKNIQIHESDVLVSKDGTIGKVAYLRNIPGEGTLNSGVFVIRSKADDLSQDYLALVFLSTFFDDFISKIVAGSTIVHLYQKDIVNFTFLVPPTVQEQKSIAHFLTALDDEIHSLENKKAKYESIKQGMMQQLLTGTIRLV